MTLPIRRTTRLDALNLAHQYGLLELQNEIVEVLKGKSLVWDLLLFSKTSRHLTFARLLKQLDYWDLTRLSMSASSLPNALNDGLKVVQRSVLLKTYTSLLFQLNSHASVKQVVDLTKQSSKRALAGLHECDLLATAPSWNILAQHPTRRQTSFFVENRAFQLVTQIWSARQLVKSRKSRRATLPKYSSRFNFLPWIYQQTL